MESINRIRRERYAKELKTYDNGKLFLTLEDVKTLKRRLASIERAIRREIFRREIASGKVC